MLLNSIIIITTQITSKTIQANLFCVCSSNKILKPSSSTFNLRFVSTSLFKESTKMANKICPETSTTSFSSSPYISLSRESFTIWMKSLVFNGNGCTAYNSKGEISFRIDNYQERCRNREIYLMDPNGKVLFSIQKEKIPFIGKWNIYKWSDTDSCKGGPWFRVKKNYKASQKNCQVCIGWDNSNISCYKIIETTSDKLAYKIVDSQNHHVAEVKRKQSSNGVDLGDDVLSLMVEPQKDYSFIVALVAVRGLISGKL